MTPFDDEADPVTALGRLMDISELDLFSDEVKHRLDGFARRAAERFDMPIGLVSIVLDSAQYFAGRHGLSGWLDDAGGTPVEWSFCATTVRTRQRYVIEDAVADAVQSANALVRNDGIAAYAGAPLVTSRGNVIGSCCVLASSPREFTAAELADLEALADEVVAEIEATRRADPAA